MKHIYTILFLLTTMLLAGCEKEITSEEDKGKDKPVETTIGTEDDAPENYSTVAEAIDAEIGSYLCVRGYIVASTQRSIKNADFEAPFEGSTAIVLADKMDEEDTMFDYDEVLPVCLTDCSKGIRNALNLPDNPGNKNRLVYIYGTKERYLYVPGLKNVQQYQIIQ
jgi:hypothetical protein